MEADNDESPSPGLTEPDRAARASERRAMVQSQLARRNIRDPRVLEAMARVARHRFVPASQTDEAYCDYPLAIGQGQTISQPYIVALMTELVRPQAGERALDVGSGSGYQAAVLAELGLSVDSIEIVATLAEQARIRLHSLGYQRVRVHTGDGYVGWPPSAPFDIVLVAAATTEIPPPLLAQLKPGGRLVAPVGNASGAQELQLVEKAADATLRRRIVTQVRFVPFTRSSPCASESASGDARIQAQWRD